MVQNQDLGEDTCVCSSVEGAKIIFTNDFSLFNKGCVKSMADAMVKKCFLCVPQESHKRIRHLLFDPFSMNSLSKFVERFANMLCERLKKVQREGKSFTMLDFNMKITFDAMCDMLMSIKDVSLLEQIERDCTVVFDAMLSFPIVISGTKYYEGIKARLSANAAHGRLMETFKEMITARRNGKRYHEDFLQSRANNNCSCNDMGCQVFGEYREAQNRLREEEEKEEEELR
ncbi:putative phosphatidylinositol/phosphatidylcholine transfer protein SFH12-like [Capsicum annuum]|nr:putative phosphatidylinositol/phosphatidylcholine transfer protein SFH12-like [Capsicum annuum]